MWNKTMWVVLAFFLAGPGHAASDLVTNGSAGHVSEQSGSDTSVPVALVLRFQEWEPGIEPYPTRTLITDRFLRMDDDDNEGNFVLFDRKQRIVYSVEHESRRILEIRDEAFSATPSVPLVLTEQQVAEDAIPDIAGKAVTHHRYLANGEVCIDVFAASGLLENALPARREFLSVMASEHARMIDLTPADIQSACNLASNVYFPDRHLQRGFPISQWTSAGYHRQLVSFRDNVAVSAGLFVLPEGYQHYQTH